MGVQWKIHFLGGVGGGGGQVHEKPIYRGELPKKGGMPGQFENLRGVCEKEGVVFLRGVDTLMHTMSY